MRRFSTALLSTLLVVGCSGGPSTEGLQLSLTDGAVTGSYRYEGKLITFRSQVVEQGAVEMEVVLNGMTLTATMDPAGAADMDAFANDNGEATQMTSADRDALRALLKALYGELDQRRSPEENYLLRFVDLWSNFSGRLNLERLVLAQAGRSYTSLCGYVNHYWKSTHDGPWLVGCNGDRWDDDTTYYGYLSAHADGPCNDGTYFWTGSYWRCYEPDHSSTVEYAYGGCFGQCGAGCGSPDYTVDCADHDSCVRFGHSISAVSCDDEFSATIDDFAAAPVCN